MNSSDLIPWVVLFRIVVWTLAISVIGALIIIGFMKGDK